ncbi:MAG TPA: SIMPL domain-containing protein [Pyrinomonadaceae bacterium]
MKLSGRLSLALLFVACCAGLPARAQQGAEPPLITVTGQAEVKVAPDEVAFNVEVENTDKDLPTAKRMNYERVGKILALARSYKIEPQNVQTDYISVEMKYSDADESDDKKAAKVFLGYAVSKTVVINLKDISRFESLFSDILKIGVSRVQNVQFHSSELRRHKDRARAMAIKAAQEKAVALTREIGQTIGRAYSIHEEDERGNAMSNNSGFSVGSFSAEEGSFAPGLISVTARVTVSFRLQ